MNYKVTPREARETPRGAYATLWQRRYFCHNCGFHTKWFHQIVPCARCGGIGSTGCWNEMVGRYIQFGLIYRLMSLLTGRGWPSGYWEFKNREP